VNLTKDGQLAVIHDPTINRTTDKTGFVDNFTMAELKQLNAAAKYKGPGSYGVQAIPTLQEVFDLVGNRTRVSVEIKVDADGNRYPGIEQKVLDVIHRNNAAGFTEVTSFDLDTMALVQSLEPKEQISVPISAAYLKDFGLKGKGPSDIATDMLKRKIPSIDVEKTFMTQPMIDALKPAGLEIGVWVVNDVTEMWKFIDMGVDSITTDRPDVLIPEYRKNGTR